jgi:hypothetical protein
LTWQAVRRRHDKLVVPVAPAAGNDEARPSPTATDSANRLVLGTRCLLDDLACTTNELTRALDVRLLWLETKAGAPVSLADRLIAETVYSRRIGLRTATDD